MRKRSAEEKQKQLERFFNECCGSRRRCIMGVLAGKGSGTPPFCNGVCHAPGAYPATVTAWQTAGGQGKLHFPYAALRQLPLCELAGSEHLATQAIHFPQV